MVTDDSEWTPEKRREVLRELEASNARMEARMGRSSVHVAAIVDARCTEVYRRGTIRCEKHEGHDLDGSLHFARWPTGAITWEDARQYAARTRRERESIPHPRASRFRRHPER